MLSQIDIRYSVSETIADVKKLVNAFPGNITLCLENATLYQYKEYTASDTIPTPDDKLVIQTDDAALLSRWIAIDAFTGKSIAGTFNIDDWVLDSENNYYTYRISFPNIIDGFIIKFVDNTNKEVMLEDVVQEEVNKDLVAVIGVVGAIPDCRFSGKYYIYFDKLK